MKICKDGRIWGQNNSYHKPEYIEKQREKKVGSRNPNWKGGISTTLTKTIRKLVFNFYPNVCYLCGSKKNLEIHHLDRNRKNNQLSNLRIICRSCHNSIQFRGDKNKIINNFGNKRVVFKGKDKFGNPIIQKYTEVINNHA
jgi:hypothetical protein